MNDIITVTNISKIYKIQHSKEKYQSLRDDVVNFVKNPLSAFLENKETFFALKNVSFSIKQGETVGLIGPNGGGKSTLLKILSRITPPSTGEIRLKGRVSSLLEVGTGFHPELTGRENIFLSGVVLGMRQQEIKSKFDEIVDFAGVEKFLDTPVKHYSSGMYTRLAFSVAAHLEPDILLVDEVLAVGDAAFQKKCLGKMSDIGRDGRTIIFVSHNMTAISALCKRTILLKKGKIEDLGDTALIIKKYLSNSTHTGSVSLLNKHIKKHTLETSKFNFTKIEIINSKGRLTNEINLFEPFSVRIIGVAKEEVKDFTIGFSITSSLGISLFNSYSPDAQLPDIYPKGTLQFTIKFTNNYIAAGNYIIDLLANGIGVNEWIPEAISLNILDMGIASNVSLRQSLGGFIIYPNTWEYSVDKKT